MTPLDRIDSVIDNAASQMTSAQPSTALRANVMSRIAAERRVRFPWRFVLAGGAIASVGLIAFVSLHNRAISNPEISTPTLINPTVINSTASAYPTGAGAPASPVTSVARTAAHDGGQLIFTTLTDTDQEWLSRRVAALERPELMTPVTPLLEGAPVNTIDIEPIRVAPLVVRAIDDDNR